MEKVTVTTEERDVIVIGAGISGLVTAWELRKRNPQCKVLVIEAKEVKMKILSILEREIIGTEMIKFSENREPIAFVVRSIIDRLGGRTLTEELATAHGKDKWDIGGQWVSSSHHYILELLQELNLEVYPQYTMGKKLIKLTNGPIKSYSGEIPDISLPALFDLEHCLRKISNLSNHINIANPFDHPKANDLDSVTLENLCDNILWTDTASKMIDIMVETMFGASPRQLSALFFLTYVASAGGLQKMIETTKGSAQELKVKGGTQQISYLLADKIGSKNILLSSPVTRIEQVADDRVIVSVKGGTVYICKKVVVAIPLPQNAFIEYVPELPTSKTFLIRNMPIGNLLKFIIVYEKPFWRTKGFSGQIVNEGKTDNEFEALDCVFDATSSNGNAALVGFLSAQRGLWWSDVEPRQRRQAILEMLAKFFGDEALTPVSYLEKNWYFEPYNGGCPASLCGPGVMDCYQHLRSNFGNIHFAGTETASVWIGYMEGAVEAGKRVTKEVLRGLYPELLTEEEKLTTKRPGFCRRKSQILRPSHRVFRYTIGLALLAVGIVVLKKTYFRIAL